MYQVQYNVSIRSCDDSNNFNNIILVLTLQQVYLLNSVFANGYAKGGITPHINGVANSAVVCMLIKRVEYGGLRVCQQHCRR